MDEYRGLGYLVFPTAGGGEEYAFDPARRGVGVIGMRPAPALPARGDYIDQGYDERAYLMDMVPYGRPFDRSQSLIGTASATWEPRPDDEYLGAASYRGEGFVESAILIRSTERMIGARWLGPAAPSNIEVFATALLGTTIPCGTGSAGPWTFSESDRLVGSVAINGATDELVLHNSSDIGFISHDEAIGEFSCGLRLPHTTLVSFEPERGIRTFLVSAETHPALTLDFDGDTLGDVLLVNDDSLSVVTRDLSGVTVVAMSDSGTAGVGVDRVVLDATTRVLAHADVDGDGSDEIIARVAAGPSGEPGIAVLGFNAAVGGFRLVGNFIANGSPMTGWGTSVEEDVDVVGSLRLASGSDYSGEGLLVALPSGSFGIWALDLASGQYRCTHKVENYIDSRPTRLTLLNDPLYPAPWDPFAAPTDGQEEAPRIVAIGNFDPTGSNEEFVLRTGRGYMIFTTDSCEPDPDFGTVCGPPQIRLLDWARFDCNISYETCHGELFGNWQVRRSDEIVGRLENRSIVVGGGRTGPDRILIRSTDEDWERYVDP